MTASDQTTPIRRQRGRPRKVDLLNGPNASLLRIRTLRSEEGITLHLSGSLELANLLTLRDAAFTAIGERPARLVIDMRAVVSVEIAAINTLVTIGRVARLVNVDFRVAPSIALKNVMAETGLIRLLPPPGNGLVPPELVKHLAPIEQTGETGETEKTEAIAEEIVEEIVEESEVTD